MPKVNKENKEFKEELSLILEVKESNLKDDFVFKNENFDSLKGYAILISVEEIYKRKIKVEDFIKIKTIKELFDLIEKK